MAAAAADSAAMPAAAMQTTFQQSQYAAEVADWLERRATPAEVQRFDRYMDLIQQAKFAHPRGMDSTPASTLLKQAAASANNSGKLNFTPAAAKKHSGRPATASPGSWQYSITTRAASAGRLGNSSAAQGTALTGHGIRPYSAAPAVAAAIAPPAGSAAAAAGSLQVACADASAPACCCGSSSSSNSTSSSGREPKSMNVTTTQAFHGLKELYPDLWRATVPICRPDAAPNRNFISEWGESLRQGAAEAWAPYLASTYQVANLQVAKPTDEFAVRADDALIGWAAKQKLYFEDLFTPQAAAAVAALLEGKALLGAGPAAAAAGGAGTAIADSSSDGTAAGVPGENLSLADRKGLVDMLRQLSAVVKPDSTQSVSHTTHKPQYSVEQPETTALMKEQTRIRTMGFPRKVEVKGFVHTATKAAGSAAGAAEAGAVAAACASSSGFTGISPGNMQQPAGVAKVPARPCRAVKASDMIDTLSSKVPLKWAASAVVGPSSSYTAAFGAHPGRSPQMFKTVFKEVNLGFGHVDQTLYPTANGAYPVEQLYLEPSIVPGQVQHEADKKTTQRVSYKPRDPESVARSVAAAREQIEASQAARNKSFIPLSKAGIQLGSSAQWCSAYGADFIPRKADLTANKAMAHAVSAMFNGPTIAYGKIAGMRMADAQQIAKWKVQQEAAAAAKAAAEAELDRRAAAGTATKATAEGTSPVAGTSC